MTQLSQHALSAAWPKMKEADFAALVNDIQAHGQIDPGVLYEGQVLDGWHRYKACEIAGVEYRTIEFDGEDPRAFVISKNGKRRHDSAAVLAVSAASCLEWRPNGGDQSAPGRTGTTIKEAATAVGVGERTMERAKVAVQAGLGDEIKDGRLSLKQAEKVAKLPKARREKAVKAISEGKSPKTRRPKNTPDPEADKYAPNLADELERADKQIREQGELIDSLKKSDLGKEVAKWKQKYDQLNGRVQQLATTTAEAQKTAQYQADLLAKIRKALKVQKNTEILPALKK